MDTWDQGDSYELFMGRWSREVARHFVDWLGVPPGSSWLDVGCGTGALTGVIAEVAVPGGLSGVDPSPDYIEAIGRRFADADLRVGEAGSLPFDPDTFDVSVSGLVLNFVPAPTVAVAEMRRVTRKGGVVAAYLWDYAEGMEMLRAFWDVAVALDEGAARLDEGVRFPICRPDLLTELFSEHGLRQVSVTGLEISTSFSSFDDYWQPFLGGQGPAPGYVASLEPSRRQVLESRLRDTLPLGDDGRIELGARAWAVRGTV